MSDLKSGKQLIFLDFDGVLHPTPPFVSELFCRLTLLETWLRARHCVDVVISSSWRYTNSLEELKSIFSSDLRKRVISVTPAGGDSDGSREHQIRQWLQYEAPGVPWVAIDDTHWLFSRTKRLVLCDSHHGLTSANLDEVDRLLALPPETESISSALDDCSPAGRSWPPLPAFESLDELGELDELDELDELEQRVVKNRPPENS